MAIDLGLTERQQEILDLILDGHANRYIAEQLGISCRTVEITRQTINLKAKQAGFRIGYALVEVNNGE